MQDLEEAIRERAYQIWIESGCQDGQADAHWLAARREILGASFGAINLVKASEQQPAEKPAKPKAKTTRKKRVA